MTRENGELIERWILRGLVGILTLVAGWIGWGVQSMVNSVSEMRVQMAEVRKELEVVKPADILTKLHEMERHVITKDDVRELMSYAFPAAKLKDLEQRIERLEGNKK